MPYITLTNGEYRQLSVAGVALYNAARRHAEHGPSDGWAVRTPRYHEDAHSWWMVMNKLNVSIYHRGYCEFRVFVADREPVGGFDSLEAAVAYAEMTACH